MERNGIVVVGSLHFDSFYQLPHAMRMGENLHATSFQSACGGKGANQAVQCAKLGVRTRMLGCLGKDAQGDTIEAGMRAQGVDMDWVSRVDAPTGNAAVFVYPGGGVQAALFGGANMRLSAAQVDAILPSLAQAAVAIFQNEISMDTNEYAMRRAKERGCKILYNAAPALPGGAEALRLADVVIVNEAEASFYSGMDITDEESARRGAAPLLEKLSGDLIITLGAAGSLLLTRDGVEWIPALPVDAIESTGAGDAYVGTLAYGLLSGLTLSQAARKATVAGAITVSSVGAQPAMPTLQQLERMEQRAFAQNGKG